MTAEEVGAPPSGAGSAARSRVGRPRRFTADEEIGRLFSGAFRVLRRNGYQDLTVADVLEEAELSTRSFYRHFASKDELLCAMYRREADRAVEQMRQRMAEVEDPVAALDAWISQILGFGFDRNRARRTGVFSSAVTRAEGAQAEAVRAAGLLRQPLVDALEAGISAGVFTSPDPRADAAIISAAAWDAAGRSQESSDPEERDRVRASLVSFCRRALAVVGPGPS